jgi:hypothetical protein
MNTLSLLEHMGSHKIMATQNGLGIDLRTLKHLAEENPAYTVMERVRSLSGVRTRIYTFGPPRAGSLTQEFNVLAPGDLPTTRWQISAPGQGQPPGGR